MNGRLTFALAWLLAIGGAFVNAQTPLIQDSFTRTGALNGTLPTESFNLSAWSSLSSGSGAATGGSDLTLPTGAVQTAYLDLGASYLADNPGLYALTAEVAFPANAAAGTNWVALGFASAVSIYGNFSSGGDGWLLYRENGNVRVFGGPGVSNSLFSEGAYTYANGSTHQLRLLLDTTASPWTLSATVDGQVLDLNGSSTGTTYTFGTSPTAIRYIGLSTTNGSGAPVARIDNFFLEKGMPPPTPTGPTQGTTGYQRNPSFYWQPAGAAPKYEILLASDRSFEGVLKTDTIEVARYVPLSPLPAGDVFWKVRALGDEGSAGIWSATGKYTVGSPAAQYTVANTATWASDLRAWLASQTGPVQVDFAGEVYTFTPQAHPADDYVLLLNGRKDVVLNGNGAVFLLGSATVPNNNVPGTTTHVIPGLVNLTNCDRVTVSGVTVEHLTPPHSVVEVTGLSNPSGSLARFTVATEPGYPELGSVTMQDHWEDASILDTRSGMRGRLKPRAGNRYLFTKSSLQQVVGSPGHYTVDSSIPYSSASAQVAIGDRIIFYARNGNVFCTANLVDSRDIVFENVTIHTSPWGHFWSWYGSDLKVLNCHLVPKDASAWFAGNADGIHSRAALVGPWVEGCTLEGTGDDGVALYNKGMSILAHFRPADSGKVRVAADSMHLKVGDTFNIFHATGGTIDRTVYTVGSVTAVTNAYDLTFSPALAYDPYIAGTSASVLRLNDQLFCLNRRNGLFVVRNNEFLGNRRYGTIARANNGLIKGNTYNGSSSSAIVLLNEATSFQNGLDSEAVVVRDNILVDNGFDTTASTMSNIHVEFWAADPASSVSHLATTEKAHRYLRIENNLISDWSRGAILMANTEGSLLKGNTVGAKRVPALFSGVTEQAVALRNTNASQVLGNNLSASGVAAVNALSIPAANNTAYTSSGNTLP